jgi:hypothetical protein
MSEVTTDWMEAALADLEARRAKIDAAIATIRELQAQGGVSTPAGPSGPGGVHPAAFLKLSIPDATKKYLETVRQKQSTQEVIDALEKGGLPRGKYNTIYSILARRQKQVGDIINMQGDWALAEWYPNYRPKGKAKDTNSSSDDKATKDDEKATA